MRSDSHELGLLADDLDRAGADVGRKAEKVTEVAMAKMKKGAQRRVRGHRHLPGLARSFTYDVTRVADTVTGEVGADTNRAQGALEGLIEHGSPTSEPIPHWAPEADQEVPIWEGHLADVAAEVGRD